MNKIGTNKEDFGQFQKVKEQNKRYDIQKIL